MCLMLSRYELPAVLDAERVFRYLVSRDEPVFWLDSGVDADEGLSYLATSAETYTARAGEESAFLAELRDHLGSRIHQGDGCQADGGSNQPGLGVGEPTFQLGLVGWFSYEFGLNLMGVQTEYDQSLPPALVINAHWVIELDHAQSTLCVVAESEQLLTSWLDTHLKALLNVTHTDATTAQPAQHFSEAPTWRDSEQHYLENIDACQRAIAEGEAYLLCLTTQARVAAVEHPADVYLRLRELNPSHHGGFISAAGTALLSASPERFLAVDSHGNAHTKPIKGTRPRGTTTEGDAALAADLKTDSKERAENLMIVDLMRNDFAKVCDPHSVTVRRLHDVETYTHVHQLVSTVLGKLTESDDALSLFEACFPAGSMTGTPKLRAVELLAELERHPRGLYSGCFGYVSRDGSADLAMVIRSIVIAGGEATVGAGGGITSNSNPVDEFAEVLLKADALLAALESPNRPVM